MTTISPIRRRRRHQSGLLDRNWPKPTWLKLEPDEDYIGSYPRWGRRAAMISTIIGPSLAGPAAALAASDHAWPGAALAIAGALISIVPLLSRKADRVHVTTLAFVYREQNTYHVLPIENVQSVSYGGSRESNRIFVHTDSQREPIVLMDSTKPQQTAEELAELIGKQGSEETKVEGGER